MTKTLDVLVVGGDRVATEQACERLEEQGHVVHRCHGPGAEGFPCIGMADAVACPLDGGIDVALLVRRGVRAEPTPEEDGARCAIRAGIPLVEDGTDVLDPFDRWVVERVGPDDDLGALCARAASTRHAHLRTLIRDRIAKLTEVAGTNAVDTACLVRTFGRDLVVDLHLPVPVDRRLQAALAVRVLDAVRAAGGQTYGHVDVRVHGQHPVAHG